MPCLHDYQVEDGTIWLAPGHHDLTFKLDFHIHRCWIKWLKDKKHHHCGQCLEDQATGMYEGKELRIDADIKGDGVGIHWYAIGV